jgi:hypothetical protein
MPAAEVATTGEGAVIREIGSADRVHPLATAADVLATGTGMPTRDPRTIGWSSPPTPAWAPSRELTAPDRDLPVTTTFTPLVPTFVPRAEARIEALGAVVAH